jgi:phospholipase/carboxylesterase
VPNLRSFRSSVSARLGVVGVVAAVILIVVASLASSGAGVAIVQNPIARIRTWEAGDGRSPLVLLHGYGSSPEEFLPFTRTIQIAANQRFVFPEAPEESVPPDGPVGGRAWWRLDLASYRTAATGPPDMSRARPAGLDRSIATIRVLASDLYRRLGYRRRDLILGGFSQGAMIAAGVAFRTDEPLRALILLSGTPVDESTLIASLPARKGLRVFIAHGRRDDVLPFEGSRRLQEAMRDAGLDVTWVPFDGGHEIPAEVVVALNAFLAR